MIPDLADPRWKRVLTTDSDLAAVSLATRILVARLRRDAKAGPDALAAAIRDLRNFFTKNSFALADVAKF